MGVFWRCCRKGKEFFFPPILFDRNITRPFFPLLTFRLWPSAPGLQRGWRPAHVWASFPSIEVRGQRPCLQSGLSSSSASLCKLLPSTLVFYRVRLAFKVTLFEADACANHILMPSHHFLSTGCMVTVFQMTCS